MERAPNGNYICQYNQHVECETPDCSKCGWNPEVAYRRQKQLREGLGLYDKLYKIPFTGYCEVWAKSAEEALDKADDDQMFFVHYDYGEPVCAENEEEEDNE